MKAGRPLGPPTGTSKFSHREPCLIRHSGIIEFTAVEIKTEVEDKYLYTYRYVDIYICGIDLSSEPLFCWKTVIARVTYYVISPLHTSLHVYEKLSLT